MKKLLILFVFFSVLFGQAEDFLTKSVGHPDSTYKQLLRFKDNAGVQDTLKQIYDGVGGSSARGSALWISEDSVAVKGVLTAEAISVDLGFVINEVFIDDLHINDSLSSNASETDIGIDINPESTLIASAIRTPSTFTESSEIHSADPLAELPPTPSYICFKVS